MFFIIFNLLFFNIQLISTENRFITKRDLDLTLGHIWDQRDDRLTVYFDISNSSFEDFRYYFYELRTFGAYDKIEYFPRQRLIDTHNSLHIIGLHENDYVTCVSFIDEYENIYKPRDTCYEFTLGEKTIGSHHGAKTGYLAPLLIAFAFVIHVIIVVVNYIKAKQYAQKLLQRFINVNPKSSKPIVNIKHSLKQLDHPRVSSLVQRRLSRVSIDAHENHSNDPLIKKTSDNDDTSNYVSSHLNRKISLGYMQTIPENHP